MLFVPLIQLSMYEMTSCQDPQRRAVVEVNQSEHDLGVCSHFGPKAKPLGRAESATFDLGSVQVSSVTFRN